MEQEGFIYVHVLQQKDNMKVEISGTGVHVQNLSIQLDK
jgi:hypothetical protein